MTFGLSPRVVAAPGGPLTVFETTDANRDLDDAIAAGTVAPYGRVLWASAPCVASVLARTPLGGATVLELGCGTGFVALVAARLGAQVVATDVDPGALEAVRRGAACLGVVGARITVTAFDVASADPLPPADILVAADLLYEPPLARALARRVLEASSRGTRVVVGDPGRAGRAAFCALLKGGGLTVTFAREEAGSFAADVCDHVPAGVCV